MGRISGASEHVGSPCVCQPTGAACRRGFLVPAPSLEQTRPRAQRCRDLSVPARREKENPRAALSQAALPPKMSDITEQQGRRSQQYSHQQQPTSTWSRSLLSAARHSDSLGPPSKDTLKKRNARECCWFPLGAAQSRCRGRGGRSGGASPSRCVLGVGLDRARPGIPARRPRDSTLRRRNITPPVAPKNPTHRQRKIVFVGEYLSERDALLRYR